MTQLTLLLVAVACLTSACVPACGLAQQAADQGIVERRLKGDQFEQMLETLRGRPDAKVAEQLSKVGLSERLDAARLARCMADLPGPQARQALTVLSDEAAFLDPTVQDSAPSAKPNIDAQRQMTSRMVDYVNKTIHQLPNLFATRTTLSFEEDLSTDRSFRSMGKFSALILYRNGQEELHTSPADLKEKKHHPDLFLSSQVGGLTTSGEFGPILLTALIDAAHGDMAWSHWEQGADGQKAVFHYTIPASLSHYNVDGKNRGYRGDIVMDPGTGAILRLVLRADPQQGELLAKADMMVEYGPVELGGKTYICPLRSVALSRAGLIRANERMLPELVARRRGGESEWINDVVFDQYHLYSASARILPGFNETH